MFRSKQPESLLVLHGSVIPPVGDDGRHSSGNPDRASLSNTSTIERNRSTPNNTMKPLNSNYSKESTRPNVTLSATSTLEKPPKVFVHRSVELLQEKGVLENITGRNRQSCQEERRTSSPNHTAIKTAQNSFEFGHEVKFYLQC